MAIDAANTSGFLCNVRASSKSAPEGRQPVRQQCEMIGDGVGRCGLLRPLIHLSFVLLRSARRCRKIGSYSRRPAIPLCC